jgi:hypothetical protein
VHCPRGICGGGRGTLALMSRNVITDDASPTVATTVMATASPIYFLADQDVKKAYVQRVLMVDGTENT